MRSRRIPGFFFFAVCLIIGTGLLGLFVYTLYITRALPEARLKLILAFTATALALYGLLYGLFLRRSNTLRSIQHSIQFFSSGHLQHRIQQPGGWELRDLVYSINSMAADLNARMETIREQRNELAVLFEGMTDGLLAVDLDGRIIDINDALCRWLGLQPKRARNKPLHEVSRNPDIQRIVQGMITRKEPMELGFTLSGPTERILEARGSLLKKEQAVTGVLIMFRDTTRLRKLESIRTDFVANVSHELKTPITAIKGYAETLTELDEADRDNHDRFLEIIVKQSNRLYAIVEDLLSLSRLEQQRDHLKKEPQDLGKVIRDAVASRAVLAQKKHSVVQVDAAEKLILPMNASLMEQAVANLVENALKYSPEYSTVHLSARTQDGRISLRISDQGPGISVAEQERIFERFYRIDKGRSRDMGGTGLGLAIVKHIVLAHGGSIALKSRPGQGSTFIVHLPCPQGQDAAQPSAQLVS